MPDPRHPLTPHQLLRVHLPRQVNGYRRDESAIVSDDADRSGQPYDGKTWQVYGGRTDENLDLSGLDNALEIPADEGCPIGVYREGDAGFGIWFERHPDESGELLDRSGDRRDNVVQVELNHHLT